MLQILLIYYSFMLANDRYKCYKFYLSIIHSFMLANDRYKCYKFYLSIIHLCWLMIDINVTNFTYLLFIYVG